MAKDNTVQLMQIEESLGCVYTALCDKCGAQRDDNTDESNFANNLYIDGWRCTNEGDLMCPACAKVKKLK